MSLSAQKAKGAGGTGESETLLLPSRGNSAGAHSTLIRLTGQGVTQTVPRSPWSWQSSGALCLQQHVLLEVAKPRSTHRHFP